MPVVALFSGSFCNAGAVAESVTRQLGYQCVDEQRLVREVARDRKIAEQRLRRVLYGPPSVFDRLIRYRRQNLSYLRAAVSRYVREGKLVYHGFASHLVPSSITHVLRVCVIANTDYRVRNAVEAEGMSEKEAGRILHKADEACRSWVQAVRGCEPWDPALYDIVVPMQSHSVEDAVRLICDNARREVLAETAPSRQAAEDFVLAAEVDTVLAEKGYDVEVVCDHGKATLLINQYAMRMERLKKDLANLARAVPGVQEAEARLGPKYQAPAIYGNVEIEMPTKILLVDDEREFVETLSERLQARDLESAVAYTGEEALTQVEKDEPEVMVLDLKMPGIDGMEVLRKVKQEQPNVEVIILTGHGTEEDAALAQDLGAFAYLEKPVDIDLLTETMRAAYQKIHAAKAPPASATD